jgi:hypothetical protein
MQNDIPTLTCVVEGFTTDFVTRFLNGSTPVECEARLWGQAKGDATGKARFITDDFDAWAYLSGEMLPLMQPLGFECTVLANPVPGNGTMLIARRIEDPALPTVLSSGHGDTVGGQDASWRQGLSPWTLSSMASAAPRRKE